LRGTIAAVVTPLRGDGREIDEDAIDAYVEFLIPTGLAGVMALGTTGEGILLDAGERMRVAERFMAAVAGRMRVAVHCGAQTTRDSVRLAERSAALGVDAVSAIGPPYFKLDVKAQYLHLRTVATACAPTPFYVYELAQAAGYRFDLETLMRLRDACANVVGIKVSDSPWDSFAPYLLDGFDVLVGPEALIDRGLRAGAVGAISGLASALPELVADVVARPTPAGEQRLGRLRAGIERVPRHAALKRVLAWRGVPIAPDVRAPLRDLDEHERNEFEKWLAGELDDALSSGEAGDLASRR
jgi:dihydrodipicolinate synthase/N-acetylneuraminate lyase